MMTALKTFAAMIVTLALTAGTMLGLGWMISWSPFVALLVVGPIFVGVVAYIILDDPDECM